MFSKDFIQIGRKYINKNHIVLVREDPEDNQVYIALSNGDQLWFEGTLDQLIEKIDSAGLSSITEEVAQLRAVHKPQKREVERRIFVDGMRMCKVVRIKYDDGTYEDVDM